MLNHTQAEELVDLYLIAIQHELQIAIQNFEANELKQMKRRQDEKGARRKVVDTADEVIRNTRNRVSSFVLLDGQGFKEFLDEVNPIASGIIAEAKEDTATHVLATFKDPDMAVNLTSAMREVVRNAGNESDKWIKQKLAKRYLK